MATLSASAGVRAHERIGPLRLRVYTLCLLALVMDGFDLQAMGYAAPYVLREWQITSVQLASVFVAANVGVLIGCVTFSVIADRIGRRPVLVVATLLFAVLTLATARSTTLTSLIWLRLLAGVGLGAIIPNATALIGEYSPDERRVSLMMGLTVGVTAGGAAGGFIAAWLIPLYGWRSVFYLGGIVPLVTGLVMTPLLPESPDFGTGPRRSGLPVARLFRDGRTTATVLLWVVNFMNLLNFYALSNWLATVVAGIGYPQRTAVLVSTVMQVGGTLGAFGGAWLIARRGFLTTLTGTFAVGAVSIAAIGQPVLTLIPLTVIVFLAGWCIIGSQPALNTLEATYYPTELRSTGVGWALGVGRLGAIAGPYLGGQMLAAHWTTQQMFLAAAVPAIVSTIVMMLLRRRI